MIKKVIEISADISDIKQDLNEVNKGLAKMDETVEKINESSEQMTESLGAAGDAVGKLSKGFKGLGLALKTLGISIVLKLFNAFWEVIKQNQTVIDIFTEGLNTIGYVFTKLGGILEDAFKKVGGVRDIFSDLWKVLKNGVSIIYNSVMIPVEGVLLIFKKLQLAWENSIFGKKRESRINELKKEIEDTGKTLDEYKQKVVDNAHEIADGTVSAVKKTIEATKDIIKNTGEALKNGLIKQAIEYGKYIADLEKQSKRIEAAESKRRNELDIEAEKLRQIRDDENRSISERIKANNDLLLVLSEKQESIKNELAVKEKLAQAQYNLNKNDENYAKLLEVQSQRASELSSVESELSEQITNNIQLRREQAEQLQIMADTERDISLMRAEAGMDYITNEVERLELEREIYEQQTLIKLEALQKEIEAQKDGTTKKIQLEAEYLKLKEQLNIKSANFELKIEQAKVQQKKQLNMAVMQNTSQMFGALAVLFKDNYELYKTFAIAQAVTDTIKGINAAFMSAMDSGIPAPYNLILAALMAATTLATGIANIQQISKSSPENASIGGVNYGGGGAAGASGAAAAAGGNILEKFNTNAPTLNKMTCDYDETEPGGVTPLRAYVVNDDINSTNELNRKIETNLTT